MILLQIICSFFILNPPIETAPEWNFKKEQNGIKVYYRDRADSKLKELKMTFELEANLSTIMAALQDVDAFPQWIYKCDEAVRINPQSYYSIIDFPWPLNDRDAVSTVTFQQDPDTKIIRTVNSATPNQVERTQKYIRIEHMEVRWTLYPVNNHLTRVVYTLQTDPGGSIPAWIINQAIDAGPVRSIVAFRELIHHPAYRKKKVAGVENL